MDKNKKFGAKLRELRTKAGMSLRELANKVSVDFTYLSKIETGALPPPSEKVIQQLAVTLNADKDELLTLAGKIPADIAEMLKDRETRERLRAERSTKEGRIMAVGKKFIAIPKITSIPKASIPLKGLYRLALPIFLVIAVAASVWYATPTKALTVTYPSLPSSGTLGSTYTFAIKISIEDEELLPLQQVNMTIYKSDNRANYKATLQNLPKDDSSSSSHTIAEGSASGTATVAADADDTWTYFHGTGNVTWKGTGYTFTPSTGYGYGYQSGTGTTTITYTVNWVPPSSWPAGSYKIETQLVATSETFTETSSTFMLSTPVTLSYSGGGGGGQAPDTLTAEEVTTMTNEEAAETISELEAEEAADIIGKIATEKATSIIEKLTTQKAADILEKVSAEKAANIMEQLSIEKLTDIIPAMSEKSLTERLPKLSTEKLYSIAPKVLFDSLPNVPTEQLISETPPQPPAELGAPVAVYTTASGAKYLAIQTIAGEWVVAMGTPEPVDKLMIKTNKSLKDVSTTLGISQQQPPEALIMLPEEQITRAYITIRFENTSPEDIEMGHMTFKVEKEWLEQESVQKWSVALHRYDLELNKWISLPTKRVKEDDTCVYYTAAITRFSVFAISGSQTMTPLTFQVSNLEISPAEAESGDDVTISADITNTSDSAGTYVSTLWLNGTLTSGKDVYIEADATESVSFTVTRAAADNYEVRIDRLFGSFSVGEPVPPAPSPAPPVTTPEPPAPSPAPEAPPAPSPLPVTNEVPVAPTNWWLIGGIIAAVAIIAITGWLLIARRRNL